MMALTLSRLDGKVERRVSIDGLQSLRHHCAFHPTKSTPTRTT